MAIRYSIAIAVVFITAFFCNLSVRAATGMAAASQPATRSADMRLHYAIMRHESDEAINLIKSGIDVNAQDDAGNPPIYYAVCVHNDLKIVDALLARGANIEAECIGGLTPLLAACVSGQISNVEYLLKKGADVKKKERINGDTALHIACLVEHEDMSAIVHLLITNGADKNAKNKDEKTPIDLAKESGHKDLMKLLLE